MSTRPLLLVKGVSKTYPGGIRALSNVDFDLYPGEVHALLGENGAGKSTLTQIIYGLVYPDSGEIIVNGVKVNLASPRDALRLGIIYVPQYPDFPQGIRVVDVAEVYSKARGVQFDKTRLLRVAEELGWHLNLDKDAGALTLVERQRLMITLALALDFKIVILDEPTSFLSGVEVEKLLPIIRRIAEHGAGVIYVTHRIPEVYHVADRVTVLRRGRVVARIDDPRSIDTHELVKLVVGEEVRFERIRGEARKGGRLLQVIDLHVLGDDGRVAVKGVDLEVSEGEVVAIVGIEGMGQRELLEAIAGLRKPFRGRVLLANRVVRSISTFRDAGGRFVPGDRMDALATSMSIAENVAAPRNNLRLVARWVVVNTGRMIELAKSIIARFGVAARSPMQSVGSLSGGNQQKVLLGRELGSANTRLVVMHNPSAGLDVASTVRLHKWIVDAAERGISILFSTPVLDEAFAVADRILVMRSGVITAEFDAREASKVEVARAILA